ncbi:hypothetical protein HOLleu_31208 [Holothuria leucospilota]|uniref:Uncharacterized protein n=1 Tax=Holothuria leucospilota TaxID=206669 RepID=A0A9Q1BI62_HOLLE|nr:hypothetical protein HOLleu_31208 [Holothuria leucospilota]
MVMCSYIRPVRSIMMKDLRLFCRFQKQQKLSGPYLALLAYRATPLGSVYSTPELHFGRRWKTNVPTAPSQLTLATLSDQSRLKLMKKRIVIITSLGMIKDIG